MSTGKTKLSDFCTDDEVKVIKYVCKLFNAQKVWVVEGGSERNKDKKQKTKKTKKSNTI